MANNQVMIEARSSKVSSNKGQSSGTERGHRRGVGKLAGSPPSVRRKISAGLSQMWGAVIGGHILLKYVVSHELSASDEFMTNIF